eukprot:SAG25_NODE_66_length_17563_cov_34.737918_2_plen_93_part_00
MHVRFIDPRASSRQRFRRTGAEWFRRIGTPTSSLPRIACMLWPGWVRARAARYGVAGRAAAEMATMAVLAGTSGAGWAGLTREELCGAGGGF